MALLYPITANSIMLNLNTPLANFIYPGFTWHWTTLSTTTNPWGIYETTMNDINSIFRHDTIQIVKIRDLLSNNAIECHVPVLVWTRTMTRSMAVMAV